MLVFLAILVGRKPEKHRWIHVETQPLQVFSIKCSESRFLNAGNFFFAGARLFFRSLEAAIFLFSRVARIPEGSLVLPVIRTEGSITLGAELVNGTIIRGQNQISHPTQAGEQLPSQLQQSSQSK